MPTAIYVEWEDHCQVVAQGSSWMGVNDVRNEPSVIKSLGWIVKEDKDYLTIAGCHDTEGGDIKGVSTIIKSCIVKRKNLKV